MFILVQGSERLQLLVSDCSDQWKVLEKEKSNSVKDDNPSENGRYSPWVGCRNFTYE